MQSLSHSSTWGGKRLGDGGQGGQREGKARHREVQGRRERRRAQDRERGQRGVEGKSQVSEGKRGQETRLG